MGRRLNANARAVEWLARHDPEYDWRADAARRHGNGDYVGAVIDNLRDFGTDEDEAGSVAEAISIISHAHRGMP